MDPIDPAVDVQVLPLGSGRLDDRGGRDPTDLHFNIEFTNPGTDLPHPEENLAAQMMRQAAEKTAISVTRRHVPASPR